MSLHQAAYHWTRERKFEISEIAESATSQQHKHPKYNAPIMETIINPAFVPLHKSVSYRLQRQESLLRTRGVRTVLDLNHLWR